MLLVDGEAQLDRTAYTIANVCGHDLVETPEEWPGIVSTVDQLAGNLASSRSLGGSTTPRALDQYRTEIARRVLEKCESARRRRRRTGRTVVERLAVLAESPEATPGRPSGRARLNPRVACKNPKWRIAFLMWLKWFRKDHRRARREYEAGSPGVEFPPGTYWHALRYGVNCSAVGPPVAFA